MDQLTSHHHSPHTIMFALIICHLAALAGSLGFFFSHIDLRQYPLYYLVPLILAVYIPLSVTFLLPIDYISRNCGPIDGLNLSDSAILFSWKATYWSTFLLTWVLLPVLQDFYKAGHHLKIIRLKESMRLNLKFQLIVLGVSIAAAIYLILEVGLSFNNMKLMIIAVSHIYALVLALWLMAHGLVTVAKNRWQEGNLVQNLNHYYLKVSSLVDALEDTKMDLKEEVLSVILLKENFTNAQYSERFVFHDWIMDLHLQIPDTLRDQVRRNYVHDNSRTITAEQVTEKFMASLASKFQRNLYNYQAYQSDFDILFSKISRLQALVEAKNTRDVNERTEIMSQIPSRLPAKLNFIIQCYVKPIGARAISIALYAVCVVILQSEFFHSTKISLLDTFIFHSGLQKSKYLQVVASFLVFLYMLFCSLNSLTRLKVFNMYHLVPRNSDPVSATFYASNIARMTVPLSYNFITLFTSRDSVFEEWYGKSIHLTGLFNMMNNWIPRLLVVPVILTTFNIYDKMKTKLGLHSDFYGWADFDDEEAIGSDNSQSKRKDLLIVEGKRIFTMEQARRNNYVPSQTRLYNLASSTNSYRDNAAPPQDTGMANRIESYYDDAEAFPSAQLSIWGRLGGVFSGFKGAVETRLNSSNYRDDEEEETERLFL